MSRTLPEPSSVRTLLIDAGGVLVRPRFDRVAETLARHGVIADARRLAAAEPRAKRELDRPPGPGLFTDQQRAFLYFELVLRQAGIPLSQATDAALLELKALHDSDNIWDHVLDGVPAALERLKAAGLRLAVVSNANATVDALFTRLGLRAAFDVVLDSAVEGIEKPDPRLFRMALERMGAPAATALHVGDIYHVDVVGARAAGLRAVLVDSDDLYPDADCPRVRSFAQLADHVVPQRASS